MSILRVILLVISILFFFIVSFWFVVKPDLTGLGCIDSCYYEIGFPFKDGNAGYDAYEDNHYTVIEQVLPFLHGMQIIDPVAAFANVAIVLIVTIGGYKVLTLVFKGMNKKLFN